MSSTRDRADRAAGRAMNVVFGLQALGAAAVSFVLAFFGWIVDSQVLTIAGLFVGIALIAIGVRSMMKKERLSEMDPDGASFD